MCEQYISKIKDKYIQIDSYHIPIVGQVTEVSTGIRVTYLPTGDSTISIKERSTRTNIEKAKKDLEIILENKGLI